MCAMSPRLLRPLASGFNPRQIAGLVGWWDAADSSTVTLDGTNAVEELRDKSGLGRHAAQTIPNNRPAYSGTVNGRNVMTFDGSNDFLATGLPGDSLTGYATFFVVCQITAGLADATANNKAPIMGRDSNGANAFGVNLTTASPHTGTLGMSDMWRGTGFNSAGGPQVTKGVPQIYVAGRGANYRYRRVNGFDRSGAVANTAGTNAAAGRFLQIGQDPSGGRFWEDIIAEVLVYDRSLTVNEVNKLEQALGKKWGLTITP